MNQVKIILLCVVAATSYGVLHDQVTVRLCLEYFTVAHPPLFAATSPTLLALCWGVATTIGFGLLLGVLLARVAHAGSSPPVPAGCFVRPVVRLLVVMALAASGAGALGYLLAQAGIFSMPSDFVRSIPRVRHGEFIAVCCAHAASYLIGLTGSGWLVVDFWRQRGRPLAISIFPRSRGAMIRAGLIALLTAGLLWTRLAPR